MFILSYSSNIRNSLPNHVVAAPSVDVFKHRLDQCWLYEDVKYNTTKRETDQS